MLSYNHQVSKHESVYSNDLLSPPTSLFQNMCRHSSRFEARRKHCCCRESADRREICGVLRSRLASSSSAKWQLLAPSPTRSARAGFGEGELRSRNHFLNSNQMRRVDNKFGCTFVEARSQFRLPIAGSRRARRRVPEAKARMAAVGIFLSNRLKMPWLAVVAVFSLNVSLTLTCALVSGTCWHVV